MTTYVILGFRLNKNNKIHPILKKRLDFFIKKYKKGDKVILSGGNNSLRAALDSKVGVDLEISLT